MKKMIAAAFLLSLPFIACTENMELVEEYNIPAIEEGPVMVFENSSSDVPYRIPAIASNRKGDLIAVADYRHSKSDIGIVENGRLDLRYRIRDAKTGEWGEILTLIEAHGEGEDFIAFGDPCIVADRESDRILVTSCSGNVSFPGGTIDNHLGWSVFHSEDGGRTWSEPKEISQQFFDLIADRKDGQLDSFFIGSGKISQSEKIKTGDCYRLYCVATAKEAPGKFVNYVMFSDDFGDNWQLLGEVDDCPISKGDEAKAIELPNGNVLVSSRISGGRKFNIFTYSDMAKGKGFWGEEAFSSKDTNNGVVASLNACNGEIMCIPVYRKDDKASTYLLLQSVPLDENSLRAKVGINYKELSSPQDYANPQVLSADWDGIFQVTPEKSAYSTMTTDYFGNIAFLYEENPSNYGFDIVFRDLTVEEITDGKYLSKP